MVVSLVSAALARCVVVYVYLDVVEVDVSSRIVRASYYLDVSHVSRLFLVHG